MAAKLGFEAIEYVLKKALTKKGVKGIPTIPGPAYKMQIRQLTDAMADKMRKMGYDINKVTEKQVQGLLDYAEAMEKQKLKNIQSKFYDPSGKMKPAGEDIMKKGLEGLGKKKDPFQGVTPKIVPKDDIGEVIPKETSMTKDKFFRIKQGLSTQIKLNTLPQNKQLAKEFINRKNAEFNSLNETGKKEILERLEISIKNEQSSFATPVKPEDMASGGIARLALGGGGALGGVGAAANWFIKTLKALIDEAANPGPWSRFSKMGAKDKQAAVADAKEMIKNLQAGDPVPEYLLEEIVTNPKFKLKRSKTKDPDLAEVENLAEGYNKLKLAREKKFRGPIEDFRTGDSTNYSAALDDYDLFTPITKDMYGKTWKGKKNWIKEERAKIKKTQKEIGPAPSSRHPNYRSMVQIRKGQEDRLTALDITEELGGNIKMFDKLRMHNYPTFKKTLDKRDWLMPPGGLRRREAFVIDLGHHTLPPVKKASGGIAGELHLNEGGRVPMWLGGGLSKGKDLLREMMKYFSKGSKHGQSPSEMLKLVNPKVFQKYLDDPSIYTKYNKETGIMAPQMIQEMMEKIGKDRVGVIEDILRSARNIKKADDSAVTFKTQVIEDLVSKGTDRKTAEMFAEQMSEVVTRNIGPKNVPKITDEGLLQLETIKKNLIMKDRKLHAAGGLAHILGV